MTKTRLGVLEEDCPSTLFVDVLSLPGADVVAQDLHLACIWADQLLQQGLDYGLHSRTQHHDWDVVLQRPLEEGLESGVQLDVVDEVLDALVVGLCDTVHHILEGVAESDFVVEAGDISGAALVAAVANVVGHEVIGVLEGDCAVKVGEEDELGVVSIRGSQDD